MKSKIKFNAVRFCAADIFINPDIISIKPGYDLVICDAVITCNTGLQALPKPLFNTYFIRLRLFRIKIRVCLPGYTNVDDILSHLKSKIELHSIAVYIGEFDHYSHTKNLEHGKIAEKIKDAKNIICCFGQQLPKAEVLAVRPRSIGVADMEDSFIVSFLEAPNLQANSAMEEWVKSIVNI